MSLLERDGEKGLPSLDLTPGGKGTILWVVSPEGFWVPDFRRVFPKSKACYRDLSYYSSLETPYNRSTLSPWMFSYCKALPRCALWKYLDVIRRRGFIIEGFNGLIICGVIDVFM